MFPPCVLSRTDRSFFARGTIAETCSSKYGEWRVRPRNDEESLSGRPLWPTRCERMRSARQNLAVLGLIGGALVLALAAILVGTRPKSVSIRLMGLRDTPWPDGKHPLFVITNPLPYRVTWTMLAPEFE